LSARRRVSEKEGTCDCLPAPTVSGAAAAAMTAEGGALTSDLAATAELDDPVGNPGIATGVVNVGDGPPPSSSAAEGAPRSGDPAGV
jgi:hypothetical protein